MLPLIRRIQDIIRNSRLAVVQNINTIQVTTNFEIGRQIVEHEQQGRWKAEYGKQTIQELSYRLTEEFGRGFSKRNLEYMRRFYLEYGEPAPETLSEGTDAAVPWGQSITQTPSAQFTAPFALSWSHYILLMTIDNQDERRFYESEAQQNRWSLSELKRQFNSGLYERLALSRDRSGMEALARTGHVIEKPQDMLKDPYVLEFLGLDEKIRYSESDLESAIIDKLETFLLELGKGFLFEARQKRLTFDADHFFVDLVFYNRILRCYVLLDLKIGKITHGDIGQMQMYVNYYDREIRQDDENPTVGIILCKIKNDALVELTLPKDANIYASRYQVYLPSKEDLKKKLMEWSENAPKGE